MPERPDIGRMIEEELAKHPKPKARGDKPIAEGEIAPLTLEERLRAKAGEKPAQDAQPAPIALDEVRKERQEKRESASLGKDYEMVKRIGTGSAKEAFREKLIESVLGGDASPEMTEELMGQHDVWKQLDTFLAGPAAADKAVEKITQRLQERAAAIRKRKDTQSRYRGGKAA